MHQLIHDVHSAETKSELLKLLLQAGADVNAKDLCKVTNLLLLNTMTAMILWGFIVQTVHTVQLVLTLYVQGNTALHLAAAADDVTALTSLLQSHTDVNALNNKVAYSILARFHICPCLPIHMCGMIVQLVQAGLVCVPNACPNSKVWKNQLVACPEFEIPD